VNPVTQDRPLPLARREAIIEAAVEEFAAVGFAAATTAAIARRAGISQPYVFRFFPTKKDLALAVIDRAFSRVLADWESAVPEPGESRLQTLGRTYVEGLRDRRSELMVHLQAYAGSHDPDIAEALRHHMARVFRYIVHLLRRDGHPTPEWEAAAFYGRGLLITSAMAVGLESELLPHEWAGICTRAGCALRPELDEEPEPAA
jgi:AcrR family transcriptional regulator